MDKKLRAIVNRTSFGLVSGIIGLLNVVFLFLLPIIVDPVKLYEETSSRANIESFIDYPFFKYYWLNGIILMLGLFALSTGIYGLMQKKNRALAILGIVMGSLAIWTTLGVLGFTSNIFTGTAGRL